MNFLRHFDPVGEFFPAPPKPTGRLRDIVHFDSGMLIEKKKSRSTIVLFSLLPPALSPLSDSFPIQVRKRLYDLFANAARGSAIFDIGHLTLNDKTEKILKDLFAAFNGLNINFVILSSVKQINTLLYNAIRKQYKSVLMAEASPFLPLADESGGDLFKKCLQRDDNNLFNFANFGMQAYLNSQANQDLFRKLLFDTYRMGLLQNDIRQTEPAIRDSHVFTIDLNAIRVSDAPATEMANPSGFSGYDACRMSRFAGVAERNRIFCLNGLPQNDDQRSTTSFLAAQMLWFFTEGIFHRRIESPAVASKAFTTYIAETTEYGTFTFFQSRVSDRWWVQMETGTGKNTCISCLREDYLDTLNGEIPERFVKFFQKIT